MCICQRNKCLKENSLLKKMCKFQKGCVHLKGTDFVKCLKRAAFKIVTIRKDVYSSNEERAYAIIFNESNVS